MLISQMRESLNLNLKKKFVIQSTRYRQWTVFENLFLCLDSNRLKSKIVTLTSSFILAASGLTFRRFALWAYGYLKNKMP